MLEKMGRNLKFSNIFGKEIQGIIEEEIQGRTRDFHLN